METVADTKANTFQCYNDNFHNEIKINEIESVNMVEKMNKMKRKSEKPCHTNKRAKHIVHEIWWRRINTKLSSFLGYTKLQFLLFLCNTSYALNAIFWLQCTHCTPKCVLCIGFFCLCHKVRLETVASLAVPRRFFFLFPYIKEREIKLEYVVPRLWRQFMTGMLLMNNDAKYVSMF